MRFNPQQLAERWRADIEVVGAYYNLATLQAITYEGDMGQAAAFYLYESAWSAANPERRP